MATLEVEIQNSKPLHGQQRAIVNILFTASWLDCLLNRHLRPYGLTHPQYNILRILSGSFPKGLSVLDIKNRMIDRNSNVSRLVEKLRQRDLVERLPYTDDRRMVVVTLAEAGQSLLEQIEREVFAVPNKMLATTLCDAEMAQLGSLLDKFRE